MAVGLHVQAVWRRTRVLGAEDVAVCTYDLWSETLSDFSVAHITAIHASFVTFWDWLRNNLYPDNIALREVRYYDDYNGDGSPGEADLVIPGIGQGVVAGTMCPPQVAISVTEMLGPGSRRHWGRFYLPSPAVATLAEDGTLSPSNVSALANNVQALYNAWNTAEHHPIVWVTENGAPVAPVEVAEIRVDEILDVQRRRRWESTQIRETRAIT